MYVQFIFVERFGVFFISGNQSQSNFLSINTIFLEINTCMSLHVTLCFSSVSFQGKVNQRLEGKILLVCDDITVVALQGQLKGQLAHVPTRKVTLKEQVHGFCWIFYYLMLIVLTST